MNEHGGNPGDAPGDLLSALPAHLASQVLARLGNHRDIAAASSVCSSWRGVVADEAVWRAAYAARFPPWGAERAFDPARQRAAEGLSWPARYRWRLGLERAWRGGRRRLVRPLDAHHHWVNAVRLVPGAGVASGGSEGAVCLWSLDGSLQHHNASHSQAVWSLDASADRVVSGGMDGYINVLDLGSGRLSHQLPVGWRGPAGVPADAAAAADWQLFDVAASVQLLPGGQRVLAGCMDGQMQLLDLRCGGSKAAVSVAWGEHAAQQAQQAQQQQQPATRFWWRRGGRAGGARLCAARCHEHVLAAGGDAAAVSLHDLRMGGACFAELALPAGGGRGAPSVFALDLLWPLLAAGGDRGQVQVWDLSRLSGAPSEPPTGASGSSTPRQHSAAAAGAGEAVHHQQQQQQQAQRQGWPSPDPAPRQQRREQQQRQSEQQQQQQQFFSTVAGSPAALSLDCLLGSNASLVQPGDGLHMGCVYGLKLLPDGCVLTADHAGWVRCWRSARAPLGSGRAHGAAGGAGGGAAGPLPSLVQLAAFAPSVDDPASALIDLEGGELRPVGMHCVDACLTHLAVAGRDSVVRLYSYDDFEEGEEDAAGQARS